MNTLKLVLVLASFCLYSCSNSTQSNLLNDAETSTLSEKELNDIAFEIACIHWENGGTTFNLKRGNLAHTHFFAVAIFPEKTTLVQNQPSESDISNFMNNNIGILAKSDNSVGTWYDAKNDRTVIDLVKTLPSKDLAIDLGFRNNQEYIFDLFEMRVVPTGFKRSVQK